MRTKEIEKIRENVDKYIIGISGKLTGLYISLYGGEKTGIKSRKKAVAGKIDELKRYIEDLPEEN